MRPILLVLLLPLLAHAESELVCVSGEFGGFKDTLSVINGEGHVAVIQEDSLRLYKLKSFDSRVWEQSKHKAFDPDLLSPLFEAIVLKQDAFAGSVIFVDKELEKSKQEARIHFDLQRDQLTARMSMHLKFPSLEEDTAGINFQCTKAGLK